MEAKLVVVADIQVGLNGDDAYALKSKLMKGSVLQTIDLSEDDTAALKNCEAVSITVVKSD